MRSKKNLKIIQVIAPSVWASYLINGDASSLNQEDIEACDNFVASLPVKNCIDCTDCGFLNLHDAYEFMPLGGDCAEYTFMR